MEDDGGIEGKSSQRKWASEEKYLDSIVEHKSTIRFL